MPSGLRTVSILWQVQDSNACIFNCGARYSQKAGLSLPALCLLTSRDRHHFLLIELIKLWPSEELLPTAVVCKPVRGTVAVLHDTDDDEDVTSTASVV